MKPAMVFSNLPRAYGAIELKVGYQGFLLRAMIFSSFIHFTLVGAYRLDRQIHRGNEGRTQIVVRIDPTTIGPPPSIAPPISILLPNHAEGGNVKLKVGIPVPVPETDIRPDERFAEQDEMNRGRPADGIGESDVIRIPDGQMTLKPDESTSRPALIEREPVAILKVEPSYPDIARAAGLEGTVTTKLLIDKDGRVADVVILKTDSELFNEAVIEAAKRWVFTPAMMNRGPVTVWWAVTFNPVS